MHRQSAIQVCRRLYSTDIPESVVSETNELLRDNVVCPLHSARQLCADIDFELGTTINDFCITDHEKVNC